MHLTSLLLVGWVPIAHRSEDALATAWLWHAPEDPFTTDEGLGGGLTYAISDDFCHGLRWSFSDDFWRGAGFFVTCPEIHAAVARAFDSWAANHKAVHFVNVGGRGPVSAEVDVVAIASVTGEGFTRGAFVTHYLWPEPGYRRTDGDHSPQGGRIARTVLTVNSAHCWYLDNTFCKRFHGLKAAIGVKAALVLGQAVLGILWAAALAYWLYWGLIWAINAVHIASHGSPRRAMRETFGGGPRSRRLSATIASHLDAFAPEPAGGTSRQEKLVELTYNMTKRQGFWARLLSLLWLIAPPLGYLRVVVPCWDCYDFEAALAHEVGHILGLHHPRDEGNFIATGYGACAPRHRITSEAPAATLMHAFTQHTSKACLQQDDLDGLNSLFPTCAGAGPLQTPSCVKAARNIGWVRLAATVALPLMVAMGASLGLVVVVKKRHLHRLRTAEQLNHKLVAENRDLRNKLRMPQSPRFRWPRLSRASRNSTSGDQEGAEVRQSRGGGGAAASLNVPSVRVHPEE